PRRMDAAPRLLAARPQGPVLWQPESLPHRRRRRPLVGHLARPHPRGPRRAGDAGRRHRRRRPSRRAPPPRGLRGRRPPPPPARLAAGDLWVGTDDGRIWRTRDDGGHWQDVTPAGLAPWSKIGILEPSPFAAESAYAAVDRHRLDDVRPYIYRTRDGGAHWQL